MSSFDHVKALTFDLFGTVLDLEGSLTPYIAEYLEKKGSDVSAETVWEQWRYRQRIEQYQDNIVQMGHSGYLPVARRACVYTLKLNGISTTDEEVDSLMEAWQELAPFADVLPGLQRLAERFDLVALSNGEPQFLEYLAETRIGWDFDRIISVQEVGAFKPDPGVYRKAAEILGLSVHECFMVSANSFDVMGAKMCGFHGGFVNRYELPYEDTVHQPDVIVRDFDALANALLA